MLRVFAGLHGPLLAADDPRCLLRTVGPAGHQGVCDARYQDGRGGARRYGPDRLLSHRVSPLKGPSVRARSFLPDPLRMRAAPEADERSLIVSQLSRRPATIRPDALLPLGVLAPVRSVGRLGVVPLARSLPVRAVADPSHSVVAGGLRESGAERVRVCRPPWPRSRHPRPQPTGTLTTSGGPTLRPGICSVPYRDLPPEE